MIETLTLLDQCLASAANDKVVVTYVKGDVYDTTEITAGVSVLQMHFIGSLLLACLRNQELIKKRLSWKPE